MKTCFVIAPIGEPNSETRRRSDRILKYVITPAVAGFGYETLRADGIAAPGLITGQVIQHILNDPLVVADLTERNPNVFYELAIRHAVRKPLIQIIERGEIIPFDLYGMRMIQIDHKDLESVELAKQEIIMQLRSLEEGDIQIDTPISMAQGIQILQKSEDPEKRTLADVIMEIAAVRTSLDHLSTRFDKFIAETEQRSPSRIWASESTVSYFSELLRTALVAPNSDASKWQLIGQVLTYALQSEDQNLQRKALSEVLSFIRALSTSDNPVDGVNDRHA